MFTRAELIGFIGVLATLIAALLTALSFDRHRPVKVITVLTLTLLMVACLWIAVSPTARLGQGEQISIAKIEAARQAALEDQRIRLENMRKTEEEEIAERERIRKAQAALLDAQIRNAQDEILGEWTCSLVACGTYTFFSNGKVEERVFGTEVVQLSYRFVDPTHLQLGDSPKTTTFDFHHSEQGSYFVVLGVQFHRVGK